MGLYKGVINMDLIMLTMAKAYMDKNGANVTVMLL